MRIKHHERTLNKCEIRPGKMSFWFTQHYPVSSTWKSLHHKLNTLSNIYSIRINLLHKILQQTQNPQILIPSANIHMHKHKYTSINEMQKRMTDSQRQWMSWFSWNELETSAMNEVWIARIYQRQIERERVTWWHKYRNTYWEKRES